MNRNDFITALGVLFFILVIGFILLSSIAKYNYSQKYLEECKANGYYGIKVERDYSDNIVCTNLTEEEKINKAIDEKIRSKKND